MRGITDDVRLAWCGLVRRPSFVLSAVIPLAVATGAAVSMFAVVDAVLLKPLPYPDAERLVQIWETNEAEGIERSLASSGDVVAWQERATCFESIGAYWKVPVGTPFGGDEFDVPAANVTASLLDVLGVRPILGSTSGPAGDVFIGHALWQRRFGGDPAIVGKRVAVPDYEFTIAGVMPDRFSLPDGVEAWYLSRLAGGNRTRRDQGAIAKLRPGVTLVRAQGELQAVAAQLADEFPETNRGWSVRLVSLQDQIVHGVRPALAALGGVVLLLLLLACVNLATLALARAVERERDFAVRLALGAASSRIAREFAVEMLMVSVAAALAGTVLAGWATWILLGLVPNLLPRSREVAFGWDVAAFAAALAFGVGLTAALIAASRFLRRFHVMATLRSATILTPPPRSARSLNLLVTGQVAFTVIALVAGGLAARNFTTLAGVDPGFTSEGVLVVRAHPLPDALREMRRTTGVASDALTMLRRTVLEQVRADARVTAAAFCDSAPFGVARPPEVAYEPDSAGRRTDRAASTPLAVAVLHSVTPSYFAALRTPLVAGRPFTTADTPRSEPVAIVSTTLALRDFGESDVLGRTLRLTGETTPRRIVGIVPPLYLAGPAAEPRPDIYVPLDQRDSGAFQTLLVRTDRNPGSVAPTVRHVLEALHFRVLSAEPLQAGLARTLARPRFASLLFGGIAVTALLLAAAGMHALLAFSARTRKRELAVRAALGARRGALFWLVVRRALLLAAAGLAVGLPIAAALARFAEHQLFGVRPADPATYVAVTILLLAAAVLAACAPALGVARTDPAETLRAE